MIHVEQKLKSSVGEVKRVTMKKNELEVVLISYGASIYSIKFKGREVTVRPDDLDDFLNAQFYYGKTCGRTSGRLLVPSYSIDGIQYPVKPYKGETTKLHGGKLGFSHRHFELVSTSESDDLVTATFKIVSPDQEEDYPGELTLYVTYLLDQNNKLRIEYEATSTKDTLCSITNHVYINLDGEGSIENHHVEIEASQYVSLHPDLTPHKKSSVENTPFDLRQRHVIKDDLHALKDTPIGGFDHTWIFDHKIGHAVITDSKDDYRLDIQTNYPALVVFTHNVISPDVLPKRFKTGFQSALTIECEYEPGGIHYKDMSDAILRQNETYHHWIDLQFDDQREK